MKTNIVLFVAFVMLICAACQKDFTVDEALSPSRTTTDSSLLKIYIELDTIGGIDTLLKITYDYDSQSRLISSKAKGYTDSFFTNRYYTYNGNDTLVNKLLEIYYSTSQTNIFYDSAFTYFTRNSNNKITKDSSIIFHINQGTISSSKLVSDFTYFSADSIQRVIKEYNPSPTIVQEFVYKQVINGSNIIKETEYGFDFLLNTFYINRVADFTYDNKFNPFYSEKINYPIYLNINNISDFFTSKHNILTQNVSGFAQNTNYTYNIFGLPLISITSYPGSSSEVNKGIFIYGN